MRDPPNVEIREEFLVAVEIADVDDECRPALELSPERFATLHSVQLETIATPGRRKFEEHRLPVRHGSFARRANGGLEFRVGAFRSVVGRTYAARGVAGRRGRLCLRS